MFEDLDGISSTSGKPEFQNFNVFPNPNSGEFKTILSDEFLGGELRILNLIGQLIHSQKINFNENQIKLPSAIENGIYLATLQNGKHIGLSKISIQKN